MENTDDTIWCSIMLFYWMFLLSSLKHFLETKKYQFKCIIINLNPLIVPRPNEDLDIVARHWPTYCIYTPMSSVPWSRTSQHGDPPPAMSSVEIMSHQVTSISLLTATQPPALCVSVTCSMTGWVLWNQALFVSSLKGPHIPGCLWFYPFSSKSSKLLLYLYLFLSSKADWALVSVIVLGCCVISSQNWVKIHFLSSQWPQSS